MFKRYIATITALVFFISIFPFMYGQKVYAYQNNSYFNNINIGLISMSNTTLNIVVNGDYILNGQLCPTGTNLSLGITGTSLTLNGLPQNQITLVPKNATNLLTLTAGSISNKYMGTFNFKLLNNKLLPINNLDIENYLKGVVGYELSDSCPLESLKAQTVAARNYALSRLGWEKANGYDFDDTTAYQVYKGYNASFTNVINAVDQTKGQVLLYNDALVETLYSAWHGGVSENSENVWGNYVPYLRSVQDPYENLAWPNGNVVLTNAQIQTTLVSKKYLISTDTFVKLDLTSITKFTSGRVSNINIVYKDLSGTLKTLSVVNDATRTFLVLPSNLYTVTYDSTIGAYTFSGKGNGHGLGMSQIGAKNRAAAGQTYDQILKFYYQNVYLQNLILKASLANSTLNTNALYVGNTVTVTSAATGGNGFGFLFKYVVKNNGNVVFTQDYSNASTLNYIPTAIGNYTVDTYLKDNFSISPYDDIKTTSFNVYVAPTLNSFTLTNSSTLVGQAVAVNTNVQGGSGSYLYKYVVNKDGSTLTTKDFSSDIQFSYTPSVIGNYSITAYVKDSISTNSYDLMSSLNFVANDYPKLSSFVEDKTQLLKNDTINFSASGTGGSLAYQYKFVVSKDNLVVYTQSYGTPNTLAFIPTLAGTYTVAAYIKDNLSQKPYDATSNLSFNVYDPKLGNVAATGYFYEGKAISLNTGASGASSAGLSYKYEVYSNGTLLTSNNFSSLSSFTYTPASAGTYTIKVYIKDGLSNKTYDDVKQFALTINSKPLYLMTLPLSIGMNNIDVVSLQNALIKLGYSISSATGYFGTQTNSAVISFQTSAGLNNSGLVSTLTYNALNDALITKLGVKTLNF